MTDGDKSKPKKGRDKIIAPEDLEKTVMDVDIRDLDLESEDSDLHDNKFFEEEEITGKHEVPKERKAAPPKPPEKPPPKKVLAPPPPQEVKKEKKKEEKRAARVKEEYPEVSQILVRPKISFSFAMLSLVFFLLQAEGLVEVLRQGAALKWAGILSFAFSALMLGGILLKRWEGKFGFLWIAVSWFSLVTYSGFKFFTSDPESLHFFKVSLNTLLGPILCVVGGIIALNLLSDRRVPFLVKILSVLAWLLIVMATGFSVLGGKTFEDGLWGPGLLSKAPIFMRPGVLALGIAFPLFIFSVLIALTFRRHLRRGVFKAAGIQLLILSVLGMFLGSKLLNRQGVDLPLVGPLTSEEFFGSTLLDPQSSLLRLLLVRGKPHAGQDEVVHLEVAASRSRLTGNARQSWLMVKNLEGRSFAAPLSPYLSLSRGDKKITGVKARLEISRLGEERHLVILIDLPALVETQVKTALASALYRLADQLRGYDSLEVQSAGASVTLVPENKEEWKRLVEKTTVAASGPVDLWNPGIKKVKGFSGIKKIVAISGIDNLPPPENRQTMLADAKSSKSGLSFLALGSGGVFDEEIYLAPQPAALGFELLSAAAEALGDFNLQFPDLPALPKINLARDNAGQVLLHEGKVDFQIVAVDPSIISSLQLKVDEEKPLDLDPKILSQSVDLSKLKIKPGLHRFSLILNTTSGDGVTESFESRYTTKIPLQFMKPLDKDTIAGTLNVMFSEGRIQGVQTLSIDLWVDGVKIGSATAEPFIVPLDTTTLSEGVHTLQAIQSYSDNTTESAQVQIHVSQQVPQIKMVRPSNGEYLDNLAQIEADIGGGLFAQVQNVEFLIDGEWVGESVKAPFKFLWPNISYPPGKYFIQARAHLANQATNTDAVQIQLGQGEMVVQADPSINSTGTLFPDNVEVLIDSSKSMNEPIGQTVKFDLAKSALSELFQTLPQNVFLNVRLYGEESEAAQGNCTDSVLLKNPASQLDALEAKGTSPLAFALDLLAKDFKKSQGSRVGLLITDGWDKCKQDPIEVAKRLAKTAERLRLHIIYFSDVDTATESLLKKMAEVMGGRIYKVSRQEELRDAIRDAVQVSFSLKDYKNTPVIEQPLSSNPFMVRAGEYKLEIDTVPSIEKDNVVVTTGSRKTFTVLNQEGKYELREE